ncbi:MAG: IS630 family transposase [Candidatus Sericytochromatia bacterium]
MHRRYARSLRGTRADGSAPVNYGDNISLIGAIRLDGITTAMTIAGAVDGEAFVAFTERMLAPELRPGDVVVMDNLAAHKVKGVREAIEAVGARLIYQPPYSPDLNPIEKCWSKVKHILRSIGARTIESLHQAMAQALDRVTLSDLLGWFRYCGYEQAV